MTTPIVKRNTTRTIIRRNDDTRQIIIRGTPGPQGPPGDVGSIEPPLDLVAATPTTNALTTSVVGDTDDRLTVTGDVLVWKPGDQPLELGSHPVGNVGAGTDYNVLISGTGKAALLKLKKSPAALDERPVVAASGSLPLSGGTVTLDDASEIPSTSSGPTGLGSARLTLPATVDTFTRADSATTLGSPWTAVGSAVWGINGNAAYNVTGAGGGALSLAYVETGSGEHEVACTMSGVTADLNTCGIFLNGTGTAADMIYIFRIDGTSSWQVSYRVAGAVTSLYNTGLAPANVTIRARVIGQVLYVAIGDTAYRTFTVPVGFTTQTRCGLLAPTGGAGASARWDDFSTSPGVPITWTGKTGNQLTGVTVSGVTGSAIGAKVRFTSGSQTKILDIRDEGGAPIEYTMVDGGKVLTDEFRAGAGVDGDIGFRFAVSPRQDMILTAIQRNAALGLGITDGSGFIQKRVEIITNGSVRPVTTNAQDLGTSALRWRDAYLQGLLAFASLNVGQVTGTPEGVVTANPGAVRLDTNGVLWLKATGAGNTGWVTLRDRAQHTGTQLSSTIGGVATARILGRTSAGTGTAEELTAVQVKTLLALAVADVSGAAPLASPTFTGTTSVTSNGTAGAPELTGTALSTTGLRWDGTLGMVVVGGGTDRWRFTAAGTFAPIATNLYNIGATTLRAKGAYLHELLSFARTGTPEGSLSGSPGDLTVNATDGRVWAKGSGAATTSGWLELARLSEAVARANHTGAQLASTISDFGEAVDDEVASLLVAGTAIDLTYNDAGNTLTIDVDPTEFSADAIPAAAVADVPTSTTVTAIVALTQAAYDLLSPPNASTFYIITP